MHRFYIGERAAGPERSTWGEAVDDAVAAGFGKAIPGHDGKTAYWEADQTKATVRKVLK